MEGILCSLSLYIYIYRTKSFYLLCISVYQRCSIITINRQEPSCSENLQNGPMGFKYGFSPTSGRSSPSPPTLLLPSSPSCQFHRQSSLFEPQ